MSDHSSDVHAAVHAALVAANVSGGRVHDDVPQNVAFPFVQLGEADSVPDATSAGAGGSDGGISETLTIHVWSRKRGGKEAQRICSAIYDALHERTLSVAGRASAFAWVRSRRVFRDPDGKTRHGVVAVEIIHRS